MIGIVRLTFLSVFMLSLPVSAAINDVASGNDYVTVIASDNQAIQLEFDMSQIERTTVERDNKAFDAFLMPGAGATMQCGKPVLPAVSRFVVVPPDAGLEFRVDVGEPRRIHTENSPALCVEEGLRGEDNLMANQEVIIYPSVVAEMSAPSIIRGVRVVKITTYPVRYDYSTNSYLHYDRINTDIVYTDAAPINAVTTPNRRNRSQNFLKYIDGLTVNGADVGRDDPEEASEFVGHYLIAAHENTIEYAAPFIEWRRKSGYKVDILSLAGNQAGNAGTVKREIQDRYDAYLEAGEDPFEYLLLIGDRSQYSYPPSVGWILQTETGNTIWNYAPHADYKYSLLEGGDDLPDVAVSRWPSGSRATMELAVARTLAYEAEPYMDDTDWFTRGMVYSQHWGNGPATAWHITIHTNVRWGEEVLQRLGYNDITFYEYYPHDRVGERIGPEIRDVMNDGCNVMMGRAENYYFVPGRGNHSFDQEVDENVVFPININACGHGEWAQEIMFRTGSANNLKGYVATSNGWGGPMTGTMSAIWLEMVNGIMLRDLPFGWGRSQALTAFETYFPNNINWMGQPLYGHVRTDYDTFGDPGLQPWIGVPRVVDAVFPDQIVPEMRYFEVTVYQPDNDDAEVAGAQVTLYAPGDMPRFNSDNYADYDDMKMWTTNTDSHGVAFFSFDGGIQLDGDELYVTVTGRDIRPFFGEVAVEAPDAAVEIAGFDLVEAEGVEANNGNGEINPGETFILSINAANIGGEDLQEVTAVVTCNSPWIAVEENNLSFGDIAEGGNADGDATVTIVIAEDCPDGDSRPAIKPILMIEFSSGDQTFLSSIPLNSQSPNFIAVNGDNIQIIPVGEEEYELDVVISNIGSVSAPPVTAEIRPLELGISVTNSFAEYPEIGVDEEADLQGDPFIVTGNTIAIPGSIVDMLMILTSDNGFIDSTYFQLQVGRPRENAPLGPDKYGYICFDDTDDEWDIAPDYEWIEISRDDRDRVFNGVSCQFEGRPDHNDNAGESTVVELGFETQFYGEIFDRITICTNGFIAMGDQGRVTNYQNWPMDRAMGGGLGMIAPLWDKLAFGNSSQVYYYYDEEENRFIVEWYKLRHRTGGNTDLTFQVILLDRDNWGTETGDQNVVIQYKSVVNSSNIGGTDQAWTNDNPYASVGISSPDGTTGISFTYNNQYPVQAAELENRRALLFATSPKYRSGVIYGVVTDAATDEPIPNASVTTEHGIAAITDEEGYFRMGNGLAEIPFNITARKFGYNDSTHIDTFVVEDDSVLVNFNLLHPEFRASAVQMDAMLEPDFDTVIPFRFANDGNGPLDWSFRKRLPGNADADAWEHRESFFVGDTTDDSRMKGVVSISGRFYCSGGGTSARDDNFIYVLDSTGSLVTSYRQFNEGSRYGMGDLAWDGGLIWGGEDANIYGFTPEGELRETFLGPFSPNQALAWDEERQLLWISAKTSQYIAGYTREGREVARLNRFGFTVYGLAYYPEDPDGYPLYVQHLMHVADGDISDKVLIHKINPETNDTMFVAELGQLGPDTPEGAFITNQYDVYSWVLISMSNSSDPCDRIDVWQIDARREWFNVYASEEDTLTISGGRLETEESQDLVLRLNSLDLPRVPFLGELIFRHNALPGADTLHVFLDVIGGLPPSRFTLLSPGDGDTINANIDEQVLFEWEQSVDPNWGDRVSYNLWVQSGVDSLIVGRSDSTSVAIDIVDIERVISDADSVVWWVVANSDPNMVYSNERFRMNYIPSSSHKELSEIPVEFGFSSIYPSPFNGITNVRFGIDLEGNATLRAYDISGRWVTNVFEKQAKVGEYDIVWDASSLPSGLYLLRLESKGRVETAKIALIK